MLWIINLVVRLSSTHECSSSCLATLLVQLSVGTGLYAVLHTPEAMVRYLRLRKHAVPN